MPFIIRQLTVVRALIRALLQCGDYLLPEDALREAVDITVTPTPTTSEVDELIRHLSSTRLIIDGDTVTGRGWKLTANGKVWSKENRVA